MLSLDLYFKIMILNAIIIELYYKKNAKTLVQIHGTG